MRLMCVLCKIFGGDNMFLHLSVAELVLSPESGHAREVSKVSPVGFSAEAGYRQFFSLIGLLQLLNSQVQTVPSRSGLNINVGISISH